MPMAKCSLARAVADLKTCSSGHMLPILVCAIPDRWVRWAFLSCNGDLMTSFLPLFTHYIHILLLVNGHILGWMLSLKLIPHGINLINHV